MIDLSKPSGRTGRTASTTVFIYTCENCKATVRVPADSFRGLRRTESGGLVPIHAVPGIGGIRCPHCEPAG